MKISDSAVDVTTKARMAYPVEAGCATKVVDNVPATRNAINRGQPFVSHCGQVRFNPKN